MYSLAVKEKARREKRTAGQIVSDPARQTSTGSVTADRTGDSFYGFSPFPRRGAVVSNESIDILRGKGTKAGAPENLLATR